MTNVLVCRCVIKTIQPIIFKRHVHNKLVPIISCKRKEFDFYGKSYQKFEEVPLASKGWTDKKSRGDYFIIQRTISQPLGYDDFSGCELNNEVIESLSNLGITAPSEIQALSIPVLLSGKNCLITAETGCGKTLAYLLPLLHQIIQWRNYKVNDQFNSPSALIIAPSRELATQIGNIAKKLCKPLSIRTETLVGGATSKMLSNPAFKEVDLVVSSLGVLSKLVTNGVYKLDNIHHVVLDEADTLLDDSFNEKLAHFLNKITFHHHIGTPPIGSQLTMVSATMPTELPEIVSKFIDPNSIKPISTENLHQLLGNVPQRFLRLGASQKPIELLKLVKSNLNKNNPVMVFSNETATCDWASMFLNEHGVKCVNLNGAMATVIKRGIFDSYQNGNVDVLSCTDIASRGLDTTRTKHIINYDFPLHTSDYIHRCGRTGRIGSSPDCRITNFVSALKEVKLVQKIELSIRNKSELPKVDGNITKILRKATMREMDKDIAELKRLKQNG